MAEPEPDTQTAVQDSGKDMIIHLNVGGQKFSTKRSTLCQVEGSLLTVMFSDRWEQTLERDQDGVVFLDFNPQYFALILDYLRARKIATPDYPARLPKVSQDRENNFKALIHYLGLSEETVDEILPSVPCKKFGLHSSEIALNESKTMAIHGPTPGHSFILGENVYQREVVSIKMKLESFEDSNWVFVGIVKANFVPPNNSAFGWHGSYGWALGSFASSQRVWKDGVSKSDSTLKNLTKEGDILELVLDCISGRLLPRLVTGHQFKIQIPKANMWRLNIDLHGANDTIHFIT